MFKKTVKKQKQATLFGFFSKKPSEERVEVVEADDSTIPPVLPIPSTPPLLDGKLSQDTSIESVADRNALMRPRRVEKSEAEPPRKRRKGVSRRVLDEEESSDESGSKEEREESRQIDVSDDVNESVGDEEDDGSVYLEEEEEEEEDKSVSSEDDEDRLKESDGAIVEDQIEFEGGSGGNKSWRIPASITKSDPKRRRLFLRHLSQHPTSSDSFDPTTGLSKASSSSAPCEKSNLIGCSFKNVKLSALTDLERQVYEIKMRHPDVILFVECGYRYRFFGQDAVIASEKLHIFHRLDHSFQTASVPTNRLHVHLRRLVEFGHKCGVVKQTETAALKRKKQRDTGASSGRFQRALSGIFSRGTLMDADPVYIGCIDEWLPAGDDAMRPILCTIFINLGLGKLVWDVFEDDVERTGLRMRWARFSPVEVVASRFVGPKSSKVIPHDILQKSIVSLKDEKKDQEEIKLARNLESESQKLQRNFTRLKKYLSDFDVGTAAFDALMHEHFDRPQCLNLDRKAVRHLDVHAERGGLLWFLDQTKTPFGSRLLHDWVFHPLISGPEIRQRIDAVDELVQMKRSFASVSSSSSLVSRSSYESASSFLSQGHFSDLERDLTKIRMGKCEPKTFSSILRSFSALHKKLMDFKRAYQSYVRSKSNSIPDGEDGEMIIDTDTSDSVSSTAQKHPHSKLLATLFQAMEECDIQQLVSEYLRKLVDSNDLSDLNIFVHMEELGDGVRKLLDEISSCEDRLEALMTEIHGILKSRDVRYVTINTAEYLVEVPVALNARVPKDWIVSNRIKKAVRYYPPKVREALDDLQSARDLLAIELSHEWTEFMRKFITEEDLKFQNFLRFVAQIDALVSLSVVSGAMGYVKPDILSDESKTVIELQGARHPMGEIVLSHPFIPNDFTAKEGDATVVTGPNMGGKSSYIRTIALCALLAQVGCFVPADVCRLRPFDGIYVRMGASDDLAHDRSTFAVELAEMREIMSVATARSLIFVDELGRGTATHDGTAIAFSVLDHVFHSIQCVSLFVTHYPVVTTVEGVKNIHMDYVLDKISRRFTFLYKAVEGIGHGSFGLHVARMAGLPESLLERARCAGSFMRKTEMRAQLKSLLSMMEMGDDDRWMELVKILRAQIQWE